MKEKSSRPEKRPVGRPPKANPTTSTERGKAFNDALIAAGGRVLNRLRLSPEASSALETLTTERSSDGKAISDREAIEQALIFYVARNNK